MSRPSNPLSKFRSYSYHHVLAVCDSTECATELAESPVFGEIFLSTDRKSKERLEIRETKSKGKYLILIDGFVDARFVIQSLTWATVFGESEARGGHPALVETDGEMTILEPRGIQFLNALSTAANRLSTDPNGLIFVIKTFFIGHTDGGGTELISNVRPLMFIMIDIAAEFNESGATYTVQFVGQCNGGAKLSYVNDIASQVNVDPKGAKTLGEMFGKLTSGGRYEGGQLNRTIHELYEEEVKKLNERVFKIRQQTIDEYRPVEYRFILDPEYYEYTYGTNKEFMTHDGVDDPILTFTADTTFETIIKGILISSKEVVKDVEDPKEKYVPKITSSIDSTSEKYIVTYYINRYKQPTPLQGNTKNPTGNFVPEPGTCLELDYIFTGQNIDIIDFDMKMEMGLVFFQILSTTSNVPKQTDYQTGNPNQLGMGKGSKPNSIAQQGEAMQRKKSPLFLGGQSQNALIRNKKLPVSTLNFSTLMSRMAAIENIQAKVIIHGNPQILNELSVQSSDLSNRQIEDKKPAQTVWPSWMKIPAYLKINIKMPRSEDSDPGFDDYSEPFWYDGYFQLYCADNKFVDGVFTQELEMFSIPTGDLLDKMSDEEAPTPSEPTTTPSSTENMTVEQKTLRNTADNNNQAAAVSNTNIGGA